MSYRAAALGGFDGGFLLVKLFGFLLPANDCRAHVEPAYGFAQQ